MLVLLPFLAIFVIALWLVSLYFVCKKARQPFWALFIPFYGWMVWCRIGKIKDKTFWMSQIVLVIFMLCIVWAAPLLQEYGFQLLVLVVLIYVHYRIAKGFGFEGLKSWLVGVTMVFFPYLIFPCIGFSKNITYHPKRLEWL